MDVDEGGILQVKARDQDTGATGDVEISNAKSGLSPEEIDRIIEEAKLYEEEDKILAEKTQAKVALEQYNSGARAEDLKEYMSEDDKATVEEATKEISSWMEEEAEEATKDEFEAKLKEVKEKVDSIVTAARAKKEEATKKDEDKEEDKEDEKEEEGEEQEGGDDEEETTDEDQEL
eukprot:Sspe_Gene.29167::Locus_13690_Transcript_1_1_Confidence_1.000_Length_956::g.29167::m.29167